MEDFVFKVLDRYGLGGALLAVFGILVWRISPRLVDVWVEKIKAETDTIRETQKAVSTSIPAAIREGYADMKEALIGAETRIVDAVEATVGAEVNRRVENRLSKIEDGIRRGSIPESDPPPAQSVPGAAISVRAAPREPSSQVARAAG